MTSSTTRIRCDIDFDALGKQTSYLRVVHSDNRTPWGVIPVPIATMAGGNGNTVLLSAGNHGDEYEGQIILRKLLDELDPDHLNGRVIFLPALNYPAVIDKSRVSSIDHVNMNRAFPGDPDSTPTYTIAHFVETELLPRCTAAVDLHSGGKISEYLTCGYLRKSGNSEFMRKKLDACKAFAAPYTVVVAATADNRSLSAACDRNGVIMVATELAGSGSINLDALKIGYEGVLRFLQHFGIIEQAPEATTNTKFVITPDASYFVMATMTGLFEPAVKIRDQIHSGDTAGYLYALEDPYRRSERITFDQSGLVISKRTPATVTRGDYMMQIAVETDETDLV